MQLSGTATRHRNVLLLHPGVAIRGAYRVHPAIQQAGDSDVDKNRSEGIKNQVKGTAKEVAGKVTGNTSKEVAGKAQKTAGKANDDARKGR